MKLFLLVTLLSFATPAMSGPFKVTITDYGTSNTTIRGQIDSAFQEIETAINADLPNADANSYANGMSNSTLLSAKGLGVDHASNMDLFVAGVGVGLGADAGSSSIGDVAGGNVDTNQLKGFGFSTGLMGGVNLGTFAEDSRELKLLKKLNLYFHAMRYNIKNLTQGASGFTFDLDSTTFGFHLQYQLLDGVGLKSLLRWGGLYLTTGYEYAGLDGTITTKAFNETKTTTVNGTAGTVTYSGVGKIFLDIGTHSIPIELSTNIQTLYFLSLYGGLGADVNFGSADVSTQLENSQLALNVTGQNATATGALDLNSSDGPDSILMRGFAGLQLNLSVVKLYAQFNKSFKSGLFGVNAGLRVAW